MKLFFYPRLAADGLRKNRRLSVPFLLSSAFLCMMCYLLLFLSDTAALDEVRGATVLRRVLPMGTAIVALFSVLFLFYGNSFLMRRRNREFGLYYVLGMTKGNIARILIWQTYLTAALSILCGLFFGIALSKLTELCMLRMVGLSADYTLRIDLASALKTALLFFGIHTLLLLVSLLKIKRLSAAGLLAEESVGEKPPRANFVLALLGILLLGSGYFIALRIKEPVAALAWFFIAVALVIVGTYLLFISASVTLCRLLQKNKRYYYNKKHFVSVSSMAYRMKRNGAGLASICILSTMVLVMLCSTLSLYFGAENSIKQSCPNDFCLTVFLPRNSDDYAAQGAIMEERLLARIPQPKDKTTLSAAIVSAARFEDRFAVDPKKESTDLASLDRLCNLNLMSLAQYNTLCGTAETLGTNECIVIPYRTAYPEENLRIDGCPALRVKKTADSVPLPGHLVSQVSPVITVVVEDLAAFTAPLKNIFNQIGDSILQPYWSCNFDLAISEEEQLVLYQSLTEDMRQIAVKDSNGSYYYSFDSASGLRENYHDLYGSLLFLGIMLSAVFGGAAVLMIYYKQICEGYEDQKRYETLRKVGMTKKEIKASVNSQILTVFFLPLLLAGLHLAAAFPMIVKLMQLLLFRNTLGMVLVTAACFAVFSALYTLVYKITSKGYLSIVSSS